MWLVFVAHIIYFLYFVSTGPENVFIKKKAGQGYMC